MPGLADLATGAFEKRERVKMLEMMNTPTDYEERKKAFIELELARRERWPGRVEDGKDRPRIARGDAAAPCSGLITALFANVRQ